MIINKHIFLVDFNVNAKKTQKPTVHYKSGGIHLM